MRSLCRPPARSSLRDRRRLEAAQRFRLRARNSEYAAWGDEVGSCIATMHREADAKKVLGIPADLKLVQMISFGYPRLGVTPTIEGKPLKDVLPSVGRKPFTEIVHYEKW